MKIMLQSFTQPGTFYAVNKDAATCSCPAYANAGHCKHLDAVGVYKQRRATLSARPSYSQALSALVKGIRIRDTEEAAYWLNYCWSFNGRLPGVQFRTVRRLLIGAAEDGHSIAVMEAVAKNYSALLSKSVAFERVMAELLRICKVANWFDPATGGHDYIHAGMLARRMTLYMERPNLDDCLSGLEQAISQQDTVRAIYYTLEAHEAGKTAGLSVARKLHALAAAHHCSPATRLMNLYLTHAKSLSADCNFTAQAAWLLAGGVCPVVDQIESVTLGEVRRLIEQVRDTEPHVVPEWGCDGVHCAGNDIRYAGMFARMDAVCNQFNHYGRVNPNDEWREDEFYSLDGLQLQSPKNVIADDEKVSK